MPPKAAPAYKKTARKDGKGRIVWTSVKTGEDRVRCKSNAGTMAWRKPVAAAASQAGGGWWSDRNKPKPEPFEKLQHRIQTMFLEHGNPNRDRALLDLIGNRFFYSDPRPLMKFLEVYCGDEIRNLIDPKPAEPVESAESIGNWNPGVRPMNDEFALEQAKVMA